MKRQRNETTSSAVAKGYGGTSKQGFPELVKMSRFHFITPWQGKKPLVLSEELLRLPLMRQDAKGVKRSLAASFTIFAAGKNGGL